MVKRITYLVLIIVGIFLLFSLSYFYLPLKKTPEKKVSVERVLPEKLMPGARAEVILKIKGEIPEDLIIEENVPEPLEIEGKEGRYLSWSNIPTDESILKYYLLIPGIGTGNFTFSGNYSYGEVKKAIEGDQNLEVAW